MGVGKVWKPCRRPTGTPPASSRASRTASSGTPPVANITGRPAPPTARMNSGFSMSVECTLYPSAASS